MTRLCLTEKMISQLSDIIGSVLVSLSYSDEDKKMNRTYSNLCISTDKKSLELINEERTEKYFDDTEDLTCFSVREINSSDYSPAVIGAVTHTDIIDEKITDIILVTDKIEIDKGTYEFVNDMGIIIQTENRAFIFTKKWFFDEYIYFFESDKNDYKSYLYSAESVKNDWNDVTDNIGVTVLREEKKWSLEK
jgi:hypothetical protein